LVNIWLVKNFLRGKILTKFKKFKLFKGIFQD